MALPHSTKYLCAARRAEGSFKRLTTSKTFHREYSRNLGATTKPAPAAHQIAVELATCDPASTAMIDDMVHNLHHPAEMGMTTVWLCHDPDREAPDHVHHQTSDLVDFLTEIV